VYSAFLVIRLKNLHSCVQACHGVEQHGVMYESILFNKTENLNQPMTMVFTSDQHHSHLNSLVMQETTSTLLLFPNSVFRHTKQDSIIELQFATSQNWLQSCCPKCVLTVNSQILLLLMTLTWAFSSLTRPIRATVHVTLFYYISSN